MEREPCVFVDVFHSNPEEPCAPSTPTPSTTFLFYLLRYPAVSVSVTTSATAKHQRVAHSLVKEVPKTINSVLEQEEEKINCSFEPFLYCRFDA